MVRWSSVRSVISAVLALWVAGLLAAEHTAARPEARAALSGGAAARTPQTAAASTLDAAQATVTDTCARCHNDRTKSGNLSLQSFSVATAGQHSDIAEKMIRKLRAGQMPPPG